MGRIKMGLRDFTFSIVVSAKDEESARETFEIYLKEERNNTTNADFRVNEKFTNDSSDVKVEADK